MIDKFLLNQKIIPRSQSSQVLTCTFMTTMKPPSFVTFTLMAASASTAALGTEFYDQKFIMSPMSMSGDSNQDNFMKELFEVPENPWWNGGQEKEKK